MSQNPSLPEIQALAAKLDSLQLDLPTVAFPFSQRLRVENDWSVGFTSRVIREYKRFLLLAVHARHPVTPSDAVDQAWHLHLVYTRSYWEDLCRDTLGQALHHGPTRGGENEAEKFTDWYGRTQQSYRRLFQEDPPADIWPSSALRFDRKARHQRIDRSRYWLVPKIGLARVAAAAGITLALVGLAACSAGDVLTSDHFPTVFVVLVILFVWWVAKLANKNGKGGGGGGGCGSCGGGLGGG